MARKAKAPRNAGGLFCERFGAGRTRSRYPGDPRQTALHDFLPDKKLREVDNLYDFAGMLVFDKWTCNTKDRQTVYFATQKRQAASPGAAQDQASQRRVRKVPLPGVEAEALIDHHRVISRGWGRTGIRVYEGVIGKPQRAAALKTRLFRWRNGNTCTKIENPGKRRLVLRGGDWPWSRWSHYATSEPRLIAIDAFEEKRTTGENPHP